MRLVPDRAQAETARRWGFGLAIARPWKTADEKTINHLVPHVPPTEYPRTRVPREQARHSRKTLWTLPTRVYRRHRGEVTVVLSTRGRTLGPEPTKILGTNRAELTASQVVCLYQKRWAIALLTWELQAGLGWGEHPVRGDKHRREQSVGLAVLASVFVLRVCHHESVPGKPWS